MEIVCLMIKMLPCIQKNESAFIIINIDNFFSFYQETNKLTFEKKLKLMELFLYPKSFFKSIRIYFKKFKTFHFGQFF